jgi:hypothetical protein
MKFSGHYCLIFLIGFCCLHFSKNLSAAEQPSTNKISEFQHSFKGATPKAKRDLVISAIDNGLIKRGLSLTDAKVMFEQDLQVFPMESPNRRIKAVVFFEPAQRSPTPLTSALRQGWYVDMEFSADGKLDHYSLSNLHK